MKEKTETFNQGKRYFFYILMFAILGWFIFMQIFGADERSSDTSAASVIYSGTVTWQKPDGTTQEISVPGTYKVPVGDTMVLTIQLPDDLTDTCFAIRSSLQDVDFYVGDNLRTSYSTHKTRLVGKNSASRYVFCPVYASDAGKELRIELTTYTSNYTGVVDPVFCGQSPERAASQILCLSWKHRNDKLCSLYDPHCCRYRRLYRNHACKSRNPGDHRCHNICTPFPIYTHRKKQGRPAFAHWSAGSDPVYCR